MRRAVVLVGLFLAIAGAAQAQILTGSVIGTIKDESGAVMPGVTVALSSPVLDTGASSTVTSATGEYRFTELRPGTYALTATLAGFGSYQETGLEVALGGTTERNIVLKLGTVAETITVSGESPMVDTRKVGVTANIKEEELDTIPTHRYYSTEYGKWAPGVAPSDPSGSGSGLSIMGSAATENSVLFEGVNTLNPSSGGAWSSGDLDAAEQIQIVTLGASAEYQIAQGGVFNVVFKSGTNSFKGDGSGFWFPDSLISKPIKQPCNCSLGKTGFTTVLWRNYSGHLGGPIVKNHVWFYAGGNYDAKIQTTPGVDPRLPAQRLSYSPDTFIKGTWQITDRLRFKQMYENDWWGGQVIPTVQRPFDTLAASYGLVRTYASEINYTISNNTLLTARATGWFDPNYPFRPLSGNITTPIRTDSLTGISCCGVASFGYDNLGRHGQA